MKFASILEYGDDKDCLLANYPAHRTHLRTFLDSGQLRAAGPSADHAGALWGLDADTAEAAEEIIKGDPLVEAGVHHKLGDTSHRLLVCSGGDGRTLTRAGWVRSRLTQTDVVRAGRRRRKRAGPGASDRAQKRTVDRRPLSRGASSPDAQ